MTGTIKATPTVGLLEKRIVDTITITTTTTKTALAPVSTITNTKTRTKVDTVTSTQTNSTNTITVTADLATTSICQSVTSTALKSKRNPGHDSWDLPPQPHSVGPPAQGPSRSHPTGRRPVHGGSGIHTRPAPSTTLVLNPTKSVILDPTLCSCIATTSTKTFTVTVTTGIRTTKPTITRTTSTGTVTKVVTSTRTTTQTPKVTTTAISTTTRTTTIIDAASTTIINAAPAATGGCGCNFTVMCNTDYETFDLDGLFGAASLSDCINLCNSRSSCAGAVFGNSGSCTTYYDIYAVDLLSSEDPSHDFFIKNNNPACNQVSDTCAPEDSQRL